MTRVDDSPATHGGRLLRETVYEQLRADMISCTLAPGTELREAELASRFDMSKSPVRDALMRLEREGLVITLPRQGYRVAPVSLADVLDMFHLRAALERACVERIVLNASDEQLRSLDEFRHFDAAVWDGGFIAFNRAFHRRIAELGGNARMRDQLNDLIDLLERAVQVSVASINKGDPQALVTEHSEIITALQTRALKRAQRLAEQHITAAGKRVSKAISKSLIAA
ncbi:MAG: GntR family transcriptional regulator [Polaromonas sp. 39-63-203]|uniref:GntR family transcriptional regulator n=1 Tax=Polaromonas sp. TaxID=1869339 RepID=UPI000BD63AFD|nr:GntR family transcriptional regulator [Polaromonas sp.]OYY52910.1 MAG: GntR family transcriptional regulator [Polaromonas sp. 35-63-240]OYZ02840.1 MAG: GntR family transcriptional regulator [Polaromonas sp. 28-63-22]OYZ84187.1 MAG: GntR family transcriptional regulator [Polaromonas sp. 24-62-144]OZA97240.1 MAG: GntR family transcriptional regulator [Polaromonas sp. 39-63-203]